MVSAQHRREAVDRLKRHGLSQSRSCALAGISGSSYRYRRRGGQEGGLVRKLIEIAQEFRFYGYRRAWRQLVACGHKVNHTRVYRLWKLHGLCLPRRRRKKRIRRKKSRLPLGAQYPNHVWTYDFMFDATSDYRRLKILTLVDEYTRESLAIEVGRRIQSRDVKRTLARLFAKRGSPAFLRSDNGPEFLARELLCWLRDQQVQAHHIDPGSPWQNALGESFNDKLRTECLNGETFYSVAEAQVVMNQYRRFYNQRRPHMSLKYQTPTEVAAKWAPYACASA